MSEQYKTNMEGVATSNVDETNRGIEDSTTTAFVEVGDRAEEEQNPDARAIGIVESMEPAERERAEAIVAAHLEVLDRLADERPGVRSKAAGFALANAFVAAPENHLEEKKPPMYKVFMRGAARGGKNLVRAISLGAMMTTAQAQDREISYPTLPSVQKTADDLFGKTWSERASGRMDGYKADFIRIESENRMLYDQLQELRGGGVRGHSAAERTRVQKFEALRDARLAEIEVERVAIMQGFKGMDVKNPVIRAKIDLALKQFRAREAEVIDICEQQIASGEGRPGAGTQGHAEEAIARETQRILDQIDRNKHEEERILQQFRDRRYSNTYTGF